MRRRASGVALSVAVAGGLLDAGRAHACRGPSVCVGSGVYPLGETMPSSATALEWAHPVHALPTTGVRLERVEAAAEAWVDVPVDVTSLAVDAVSIRPREGFLPDARYRLTTGGECPTSAADAPREFRTVGPAPLPTTLGTLTATEPARANVQQAMPVGGSCANEASAMVSVVSVTLSPEAAPWASMLSYEVRVDGERFVGLVESGYPAIPPPLGGTHAGRGRARLVVICGPSTNPYRSREPVSPRDGLAEGEHEVAFRARVVGTTSVVETDPVRVTLRCPPLMADAGGVEVDAGAMVDAASDASADGGVAAASTGGCSVGRSGDAVPDARWMLVGALALLSGRRSWRRVARRRHRLGQRPAPPGRSASGS